MEYLIRQEKPSNSAIIPANTPIEYNLSKNKMKFKANGKKYGVPGGRNIGDKRSGKVGRINRKPRKRNEKVGNCGVVEFSDAGGEYVRGKDAELENGESD